MAANDAPLRGKVALITGSTSGIGAGLARGLAAAGADIALNGFGKADEITTLCDQITDFNVRVQHFPADLSQHSESAALIPAVASALGGVDILVNNAGIQHVAPVADFPTDKWEALIAINLSAAFYTMRAAIPLMRAAGYGRIINIASAHGLVASPFKSAYVAAKHGIIGLTKAAALEEAENGDLTINAICPGYVRTALVDNQIKDQAAAHNLSEDAVIRDVILAVQPNKRFVTVEELAALAVLLCRGEGRSFNGAALAMDGGWTAR